jgi:hypothetical protein
MRKNVTISADSQFFPISLGPLLKRLEFHTYVDSMQNRSCEKHGRL